MRTYNVMTAKSVIVIALVAMMAQQVKGNPCPTGKYQGFLFCVNCPAGFFTDQKGQDECNSCPKGWYQDSTNRPGCKGCPAGLYSENTGSKKLSNCQYCASGTYQANVRGPCIGCPAGLYQDDNGQTSCKKCPTGKYDDTESTLKDLISECKECYSGQFQDETGKQECKSCAPGKYTDENSDKNICTNCPVGYRAHTYSYKCIPCYYGQYSDVEGLPSCKLCPVGYYGQLSLGQTECIACFTSEYQNEEGKFNSCKDCDPGTYSQERGVSSCTKCPAGFATDKTSAAHKCHPCVSGKASAEGKAFCTECKQGYYTSGKKCLKCAGGQYQNQNDQPSCKKCAAGKFSTAIGRTDESTCKNCPVGLVSEAGDTSCSVLVCAAGKFKVGNECSNCAVGKFQDSTDQTSCKDCPAGKHQDSEGQTSCKDCLGGTSQPNTGQENCEDCEVGKYSGTRQAHCSDCPVGTFLATTRGRACNFCLGGKFQDSEGQSSCKDCPVGKFHNSIGMTFCNDCESGLYQDVTGQTSCKVCDIGIVGTDRASCQCVKHQIGDECKCKPDVEIDTGDLGNMIYYSSLGDVVPDSEFIETTLHWTLSHHYELPYTRDTTAQGSIAGTISETFTKDDSNNDGAIYQFNNGELAFGNAYGIDFTYAKRLYEYPGFPNILRLGESATYTVESSNGFNTNDLSLDVQMFGHKWKIEVFVGGEKLEFGPEYFRSKRQMNIYYAATTGNREYFTTYVTSSDGTRTPYDLNPFKDGDCNSGGPCIINQYQDMAYTNVTKDSSWDSRTSGYSTIAITFEKDSGKFKCFVEGQLISEVELPSGGGGTINKIKFSAGDGTPSNGPHYLYINSLRMWDQANDYTLQKHYFDVQDYTQCVCKANARKSDIGQGVAMDHTSNQCEACPNNQVAVRSGVGREYTICGCPMGFELYNDKCICIEGILKDGKCQTCPDPSVPNDDHSVCVCEGTEVVVEGECRECPSHKSYPDDTSDPNYGRLKSPISADDTQTRCECQWDGFEFNGVDECDCHNGIITEVDSSRRLIRSIAAGRGPPSRGNVAVVALRRKVFKCTPCPQYSTSTDNIKAGGECVCNEGLILDEDTNTCVCEDPEATLVDGVCVVCKVEDGFTLDGTECRCLGEDVTHMVRNGKCEYAIDCSGKLGGTMIRNEYGVCTSASSNSFFTKMKDKGKLSAIGSAISIRGKSADQARTSMLTFKNMFDDIFEATNPADRKQARVERRRFVKSQRKDFIFGKTFSSADFGRRKSKDNFLQIPKRMLRQTEPDNDEVVYVANKKPDTGDCESVFEIFDDGMSYIAPEYNTACGNNQTIFIECEGNKQLIATLTGEDSDGGNLYNGLTEADYDHDIDVDVTCFNTKINIQLAGSFTTENGDCATSGSDNIIYEITDPVTNIRECKSISYTELNTAEANSCGTYSAEELAAINTVLNQFSSNECPLDLD